MIALSMIEHYLRHNDLAFHGWHPFMEGIICPYLSNLGGIL
jgi:hypothetical protein